MWSSGEDLPSKLSKDRYVDNPIPVAPRIPWQGFSLNKYVILVLVIPELLHQGLGLCCREMPALGQSENGCCQVF